MGIRILDEGLGGDRYAEALMFSSLLSRPCSMLRNYYSQNATLEPLGRSMRAPGILEWHPTLPPTTLAVVGADSKSKASSCFDFAISSLTPHSALKWPN